MRVTWTRTLQLDHVTVFISDVPQTPRKLKASEVTRSSVTLTWEPPESDGGSPITSYIIEKKSPTSSRWVRTNKSPVRDTVFTVNDLVENDKYEFRVSAENAAGIGKPCDALGPILVKDPFSKLFKYLS